MQENDRTVENSNVMLTDIAHTAHTYPMCMKVLALRAPQERPQPWSRTVGSLVFQPSARLLCEWLYSFTKNSAVVLHSTKG